MTYRCATFILSIFLSAQFVYGYDVNDLKEIIEKGEVEKAWTSISNIPNNLEKNDKKKVIDLLRDALFREWSRCAGDIRQVIASKLSSLYTQEAVPDFLELIRKKMPIDHECAQCGCCFVGWSVKDELEVAMEPDFFCENGLLAALYDMATFSYSKEISELADRDERHRPQLLVTLGKIGHPRYAHFISKFAGSEDPQTRQAVAYGLGLIKQPSGVRALGVLVEDNKADIRWTASKSLLQIGGEEAVKVLKLKLMQSDKNIQALAARTLFKSDGTLCAFGALCEEQPFHGRCPFPFKFGGTDTNWNRAREFQFMMNGWQPKSVDMSAEKFNPGPNDMIELSKSSPQDPRLGLNKYSEFGSCLYSISYPDSQEILLSDAIWADFDRKGRLVIASAAGELRICEIYDSNLTTVFSNNLNSLKPTPVQAPEWAKKW